MNLIDEAAQRVLIYKYNLRTERWLTAGCVFTATLALVFIGSWL